MKSHGQYIGALKGEAKAPLYFFALAPLGWAYGALMRIRASMYRHGLLGVRRLPCRVVSVGNITAGGTGKTPMVVQVCRLLAGMGFRAAVLTRGYGGSREGETLVVSDGKSPPAGASESGDEAALMASLLPGVPVVIGADRYRAGMLAVERFSPDVVVLDDGFQHMALARDLDVLLMDALSPFGNGRVLPAGYLREPSGAAARADVVVLTRSDRPSKGALDASIAAVKEASGGRPVITAAHAPARLGEVWTGRPRDLKSLAGRGVFGFSGIADPASFTLILKSLGANITGLEAYPDHHVYGPEDIRSLAEKAGKSGAQLLVTTEKDAVKLRTLSSPGIETLAVGVELEITGGVRELLSLLEERVAKA